MKPRNHRLLVTGAILAFAAPAWAQPSQDLGSYVLFALTTLRTKGLTVAAGNVGVNNGLLYASGAIQAPASDIAAKDTRIFPTSRCDDLFAVNVLRAAPGCGPNTTFTPPIIADVPAACGYPTPFPTCGGTGITVKGGENKTLTPGIYSTVEVKGGGGKSGTLRLDPGDYVFCSLELGRGAQLLFSGAARVRVAGNVTFSNGTTVGPANGTGIGPADVKLLISGSEVRSSRRSRLNAFVCAPNAAVRLTVGTRLNGTVVGKTIRADRVTAMVAPPSTSTTTTSTTTTSTTAPSTTSSTTSSSTSTATTTSQTTSTAPTSTSTTATTTSTASTTSATVATTTSTTEASTTSTTESSTTTTSETSTTEVSTTSLTSTTSTTEESTTSTTESTTTTTGESTTSTTESTTTSVSSTTETTETSTTTTTSTTEEPSTVPTTTTLATTTTTTSTTEPPTTTTETTTTTIATTTTTTLVCCPTGQIVTQSGPGILLVSTLAPFPFPAGVTTIVNVGAGDETCKHNAIIPAGGFTVPVFCIPALGFSSQVEAKGCESGGGDGAGVVWDDVSPCPDADVNRVGDTSDPDGNSCGTLGSGCDTGGTGAGNDTGGNINTTRGDGTCDPTAGVHTQLDVPVLSTTWNDADGNCPDDDLTYDPGTDTLVTLFTFILSPTTATTGADYTELNGDACSFAGNGPDHTKHCSLDASRPCASNAHCNNPTAGTCVDGSITGTPPAGPCCVQGQATTVVASGIAFTGGGPLFDLLFANQTPSTITQCNAPPATSESCVVTTNPCFD